MRRCRVLLGCMLVSLCVVSGGASAQVVTEFTAGITASSQPSRITAGPDGNLWFAESNSDRIGRITTGAAILPPTIAKSFGAASIPLNGSTSLSFTINNPNVGSGLTGVGFTDSLPAGLVVSTPNGLAGTCGGGTITATAGTGSVSLSSASLASSASCTFSVNVTGTTVGTKNNTTGAVTSVEGGAGGTAAATVTVAVVPPPPPGPAATIPTLSEWTLWLLALMLIAAAGVTLHRRRND